MDKLGKVWTKLSTTRRTSQTRLGKDTDIEVDAPVETKKVFELFAETSRPTEHRLGNTTSGFARAPATTSYRKHSGLTGRETPLRTIVHTSKVSETINDEERQSSLPVPVPVSAPVVGVTAAARSVPIDAASTSSAGISAAPKLYRDIPVTVSDAESEDINVPVTTTEEKVWGATLKQLGTPVPSSKNCAEGAAVQSLGITTSPSRVTFVVPITFAETSDNTENCTDRLSPDNIGREHSEPSSASDMSKRRSSMFVRRGSVTMEPLKRIVLDEVYQVYKQLGTGRFGFIKLAEHKESKHNIAIKFFPRPQTKQVDFIREYNYSYFLSPHPNIIDTYRGTYQTDDESAFFFVQEFCPCASLREAVEASSSGIGENATKLIMLKVLAAIEFMHNENLVHRNLKAENILIFDKEYNRVKVTDFGLTRKVGSSVRYLEYVNHYHAPELCETVVNETLVVDRSIDVWSIGILIYYCLRGRFPWQKATIMCKPYWEWEQWLKRKNLQLPKRWDSFSEKSLKLFRRTLEPRYKDRWGVKNISKCLVKEKLLKTPKVIEEV